LRLVLHLLRLAWHLYHLELLHQLTLENFLMLFLLLVQPFLPQLDLPFLQLQQLSFQLDPHRQIHFRCQHRLTFWTSELYWPSSSSMPSFLLSFEPYLQSLKV